MRVKLKVYMCIVYVYKLMFICLSSIELIITDSFSIKVIPTTYLRVEGVLAYYFHYYRFL